MTSNTALGPKYVEGSKENELVLDVGEFPHFKSSAGFHHHMTLTCSNADPAPSCTKELIDMYKPTTHTYEYRLEAGG